MQRHAVNVGVNARVRSHGKSYAQMQATIQDTGFPALIAEAKRNPQGEAVERLLSRVVKFLHLSASKVPWGPREQAAKMTFLMAMVWLFGLDLWTACRSIACPVCASDTPFASRLRSIVPTVPAASTIRQRLTMSTTCSPSAMHTRTRGRRSSPPSGRKA